MGDLRFSIEIPVEERANDARSDGVVLTRALVDVPGGGGQRLELEVRSVNDTLVIRVHDRADAPATTYAVSLGWVTRRLALAHLAYRAGASAEAARGPAMDLAGCRADRIAAN